MALIMLGYLHQLLWYMQLKSILDSLSLEFDRSGLSCKEQSSILMYPKVLGIMFSVPKVALSLKALDLMCMTPDFLLTVRAHCTLSLLFFGIFKKTVKSNCPFFFSFIMKLLVIITKYFVFHFKLVKLCFPYKHCLLNCIAIRAGFISLPWHFYHLLKIEKMTCIYVTDLRKNDIQKHMYKCAFKKLYSGICNIFFNS